MKKTLFIILFSYSISFLSAQNVNTYAGDGYGATSSGGFSGDGGQATAAELYNPMGVAVDASGNIYISDDLNERIRRVTPLGIITTVAGNGTPGFSGDGGPATNAELSEPAGLWVDASGNLYIIDYFIDAIRKVNTSGIITTVAGIPLTNGYSGDGGQATAAELNEPEDIAFDNTGNFYITDWGNNRIRKVNTSGIISTVAGNGVSGFSGDGGPATDAELTPAGVCLDVSNNLYITDEAGNRVRKVSSSGIISTIAGNGLTGFSGDGGPATDAEFYYFGVITIDANNNLYVSDINNTRIRKISTSGIISTIAGNGLNGFSGDGGPATDAEFTYMPYIRCGVNNDLYICDTYNNRIRIISNITGVKELTFQNTIDVYPNPSNGEFTIEQTVEKKNISVEIYNMVGQKVKSENLKTKCTAIDLSNNPAGIYLYRVVNAEGKHLDEGKLIIE